MRIDYHFYHNIDRELYRPPRHLQEEVPELIEIFEKWFEFGCNLVRESPEAEIKKTLNSIVSLN